MSLHLKKQLRSVLALAAGLIALWTAKSLVIAFDRDYLGESIRELYGRFVAGEDWRTVPQLPDGLSYRWLHDRQGLLKIGHALGSSASDLANQLEALPVAWRAGLHVLEVDLWLDQAGRLRCFHGPGDPGAFTPQSCSFERLLHATAAHGDYIVLDIKTDFKKTSDSVTEILERDPDARHRIIYQIYRPDDLRHFAQLPHITDYAGPIVTAYVSRASLSEIAKAARYAGIEAMTVPFERRAALPAHTSWLATLVHPVHDCATMAAARAAGFDGVYTISTLPCS